MPADAAGRRVRASGLGDVRAAASQPLDGRSAAEARGDLVRGSGRGDEGQGGAGPAVNATDRLDINAERRPARSPRAGRLNTPPGKMNGLPGFEEALGYGAEHFGLRGRALWVTGPSTLGYGAEHFGLRGRALWVTGPSTLGYGAEHFGLRGRALWVTDFMLEFRPSP